MTVGELIEELERFDASDLVVIETESGDYAPAYDGLQRLRIGAGGERYHCVALSTDKWSTPNGEYDYVLDDEENNAK
jgi:hypothetical protein